MICDSSARSSESTSRSSNVASRVISLGSAPNCGRASKTTFSTASGVTAVAMVCSLRAWVRGWGSCAGLGGHAAVDEQRRAGDVARVVGGEEAHGGGDLLGLAGAARRHGLDDVLGKVLGHVGLDEAGR